MSITYIIQQIHTRGRGIPTYNARVEHNSAFNLYLKIRYCVLHIPHSDVATLPSPSHQLLSLITARQTGGPSDFWTQVSFFVPDIYVVNVIFSVWSFLASDLCTAGTCDLTPEWWEGVRSNMIFLDGLLDTCPHHLLPALRYHSSM